MDEQFSKHDLDQAATLAKILVEIESLHAKFDNIKYDKQNEHQTIWTQIEKISDKQNDHNGALKWVIGVGIGIQAAWALVFGWFKQ